jgi:LPPG:FO 2-phospho-L-lactate transferase
MSDGPSVVALAGGVGGAKLAHGLAAATDDLTVVVNTGDDLERHGLAIWPDHDTVVYTLAGLDDREHGWGLRDETWTVMDALERLGDQTWFRLGDRDLATHLFRTGRLRAGERPTDVALALQAALGIRARVLPMSDDAVRTEVRADDGWLPFQDYFVRLRQEPVVREIRFAGIDVARPTREVEAAVGRADVLVICPSNPFVSVGPILGVPGLREAIDERRAAGVPVVAVSPIVAGRALKGPADRMLASLGHDSSALGVARIYAGVVDALVIDRADAALAGRIEELGVRAAVAEAVMTDDADRERLAREVLSVAGTIER